MLGRSKLATKTCACSSDSSLHDLLARALVGRRRQRDARHAGKALGENLELAIFGPEVVPPLRHAMRLVDGEQRDLVARQQRQRALLHEPLGRDVEQVERAGRELALDCVLRRAVERRIEERGFDADVAQRVDLILHQRDQRRDDDARAASARAPGSGSTATCRRRSASGRGNRSPASSEAMMPS